MKYKFCCNTMHEAIIKEKIIDYEPVFRTFGILFTENDVGCNRVLDFCPWCGARIPSPLNKEYFKFLNSDYGIAREDADLEKYTNIPIEFQSEEWWIKRGL